MWRVHPRGGKVGQGDQLVLGWPAQFQIGHAQAQPEQRPNLGQPSARFYSGHMPTITDTTVALKEWAAVAAALLDGRQTVLLRKGGIHEKRFEVGSGPFVLFPTVAHSHAERVRPEHRDLLTTAACDVGDGTFVVRCGVELVDAVEVRRLQGLDDVTDLHIWTSASVQADRVDFRPRHPLQVLVVRAVVLPQPVTLERVDAYGGCRSWVELPVTWPPGTGTQVHSDERLRADADRVLAAVA